MLGERATQNGAAERATDLSTYAHESDGRAPEPWRHRFGWDGGHDK